MSNPLTLSVSLAGLGALMASLPAAAKLPSAGLTYGDGVLSVPPGWIDLVQTIIAVPDWEALGIRAALIAYAADRRFRKEVAGIEVNGISVATDDRSKLMITGARLATMADPEWSTVWHGSDGNTYPVDAVGMIAISDAVQSHVNSGFATFAVVKAAIEAGEITTEAEIDAQIEV